MSTSLHARPRLALPKTQEHAASAARRLAQAGTTNVRGKNGVPNQRGDTRHTEAKGVVRERVKRITRERREEIVQALALLAKRPGLTPTSLRVGIFLVYVLCVRGGQVAHLDICKVLDLGSSAVSRAITRLVDAEVITRERDGRETIYAFVARRTKASRSQIE